MNDNNNEELSSDEILKQIENLQSLLAEKKRKEEEAKKLAAAKVPMSINVARFECNNYSHEGFVTIRTSKNRDDVIKFIKSLYHGSASFADFTYVIPFKEFSKFVEWTRDTENHITELTYNKGVEELIDEYVNGPDFHVGFNIKNESQFFIKYNIRTPQQQCFIAIPGAVVNTSIRMILFPRQEAWRVWESILKLNEKFTFQYEEGMQEYLMHELDNRIELLDLSNKDVYEPYKELDFNGYKLKDYQTVGVRFLELTQGRAIIGDPTGLGKTLQALAYHKLMREKNPQFRTVIICKASLVINIYREIKKYFPNGESKTALYRGSVPTDADMQRMIMDKTYPFTVVSYNLIGKQHEIKGEIKGGENNIFTKDEDYKESLWVKLINLARFDFAIFDEAQQLNNYESGRSIGARNIITPYVAELSATPIKNGTDEFWPLLNIQDKVTFPSYGSFVSTYTIDGRRPRNVKQLQEMLSTRMIRRERSRVQKDLEPINRIPRYFELSPKARKIYNKALMGVYAAISEAGENIDREMGNILEKINRLKRICAIEAAEVSADLASDIYYGYGPEEKYKKVLVTSFYQDIAYGINLRLQPNSESFIRKAPSGQFALASQAERMQMVDRFMEQDDKYYLVPTLMAAQEGLTITAAGACITNDLWWNHVAHEQFEGRSYGRTNDPHTIDSYYILAEDTIMVYIWELIGLKEAIAKEVVDGISTDIDLNVARKLVDKLKEDMERLGK